MIRELGEVVEVSAGKVVISTHLKSGCSGCEQQSRCGAGLLSKAFPNRRGEFSVAGNYDFTPGQQVELQLPEQALTRFSLLLYIIPLLALLAGAAIGQLFWPEYEPLSILSGALFMAASFYLLRRYLRHRDVKVQGLLQVKAAQAADTENRL